METAEHFLFLRTFRGESFVGAIAVGTLEGDVGACARVGTGSRGRAMAVFN